MNKFLNLDLLTFLIILASSLLFRITNLDLIEFKTDEAVNLILASKFAPGGTVSSIGILNPPLFNYILNPLTLFTLDPKVFSFFIGLVNSISIAFFYLIVKKYYNNIVAFTSSLLFALSPWAIIYSRKIWTQDLLIPFFILMFYSFHKIVKEKNNKFWIIFALSSLFVAQLHQISVIFVGLVFFFLVQKGYKPNLKYLLIGLILGLLPLLPYLKYEAKNNFPDIKAVFQSENRLSATRSFQLFFRPLQITGQGNFSFIFGSDLEAFSKKYPIAYNFRKIFYLEYILLIFGLLVFIKKYNSSRLLAYSSLLLPVSYFLLRVEPFMHYYIIILPLFFLFLGAAFDFLIKMDKKIRYASFSLFIILIGNSFLFNFAFFNFLEEKGFLRGDYGDTLKVSQTHIKHQQYNELFLFQFVPLSYAFGYNPFAKMIYADTKEEHIPIIENEFVKSKDPRLEQQLLASYTKEPPTLESLDILRKKTKENSIYSTIYKVTLEDYLAKNYKKEYLSEKFDLRFFYPQHWKILEDKDEDTIKVEGDSLILIIRKSEEPPYTTHILRKRTNENVFRGEKSAVDEIIRSIRFLSD